MDRKQHRIIDFVLIGFMFLFICNVLSGCFLLPWNIKEYKRPLLKSINIDSNNIVTIILDNTNKRKRIGDIYHGELYYYISIDEYEESETEIIIKVDISEYREKFEEGNQYRIKIYWFGGRLFLESIYQNGQFTVLDENYVNGI